MANPKRKKTDKSKKGVKIFIFLLISFVITPILLMSIVYGMNDEFKSEVDTTLAKMPGPLGGYFNELDDKTDKADKSEKIKYLADRYLDLDQELAIDKLYIVKKEDEDLYRNLIKKMNEISSLRTEEIAINIRNMEQRDDLLYSIHEEFKQNQTNIYLDEIERFKKQDTLSSVKEIEERFSDKAVLNILNQLDTERISELLFYVDSDISDYILNTLKVEKKKDIQNKLKERNIKEDKLIETAKFYKNKSIDETLRGIGNTEKYSLDELALIYSNLSNVQAAIILSNIEDKDFADDILIEIKNQDNLSNTVKSTWSNISKGLDFFHEYNDNINNLVEIYRKMEASRVASVVEKMMNKTNTTASLELDGEEVYGISDRLIIVDVLSNIKSQTLSKILDSMDVEKASEITSLLAQPKNEFGGGE